MSSTSSITSFQPVVPVLFMMLCVMPFIYTDVYQLCHTSQSYLLRIHVDGSFPTCHATQYRHSLPIIECLFNIPQFVRRHIYSTHAIVGSAEMSTVMSTEMSTNTIYVNRDVNKEASRDVNRDDNRDVNRDASRDFNRDAGRDVNRDAGRDVNRDASQDVNLMPVLIPAEMSSVIPAYTTPYIACRQSSCSVCHSEHQMSSTEHCSFVVPEQIHHYSVVPHHVHPVISVINIGSSVPSSSSVPRRSGDGSYVMFIVRI